MKPNINQLVDQVIFDNSEMIDRDFDGKASEYLSANLAADENLVYWYMTDQEAERYDQDEDFATDIENAISELIASK